MGFITYKLIIAIIVTALPIVLIIFCAGAFANESTARFGTDGITFAKSEDIRMLEEVLQISRSRANVKYRFLNESDRDIHTTVAFPLPSYNQYLNGRPNWDHSTREIMATFKVLVQGRPVSTEISLKAVADGRDVTAQLRELGLSHEQIFGSAHIQADQMEEVAKRLHRTNWRITVTALLQQNFPAKREVAIEHRFKPVAIFASAYDHDQVLSMERLLPGCLDESAGRTLGNRLIKAYANIIEQDPYVVRYDVEYMLCTGRNWKGPIGEFKLNIEKEAPDEFMSLCFPGKLKKISSTMYEFYKRDFVPPDKLVVCFYRVVHLRIHPH